MFGTYMKVPRDLKNSARLNLIYRTAAATNLDTLEISARAAATMLGHDPKAFWITVQLLCVDNHRWHNWEEVLTAADLVASAWEKAL